MNNHPEDPDLPADHNGQRTARSRDLMSFHAYTDGLNGSRHPLPVRAQVFDSVNPGATGDAEQTSLLQHWQVLQRYRRTLIALACLGALAGFLLSKAQHPVYRARTSVEIQSLNENFLNTPDVSLVASKSTINEGDIQTHVQLLQSNSLIARVVTKLKLDQPKPAPPRRLASWFGGGEKAPASPADLREGAVAAASSNLKVRTAPQSRLLEVLYDCSDPQLAANFLNTLTSESMQQNLEARWDASRQTGEWLTRQIEELRTKLEKSEEELQAYARVAGLLFTSEQDKDNVVDNKLKELQEELSKAQADRIAKQSRYEIASSSSSAALPEVVDDASVSGLQLKLADMRRQLAELNAALTPVHPKVKRLEAQIASVEAELNKQYAKIFTRVRGEYQSAERREKLLASSYHAQAKLASEQAGKMTRYAILKREVDTSRQLYESMLQKVKEAGIAAAMRASNLRVVDAATPPSAPYKPNFVLNTSLGLLGGVFVGVFIVLMRERSDNSVRLPGDASVYLNVPELGVIPATRRTELASWLHKTSLVGESFRSAVTSILLSGQNGDRPRVIVLSSPNPSEGKSTVAANLAIALAEVNQKVLLIDADMRRPQLHGIFDVPNTWGLSDLLRERTPVADCPLEALARETQIRDLYILPAGPGAASIANLLSSSRMRELLDRLRNEFDIVLIDTPAMLLLPDARVMAQLADAVVLVVRAGFTTRESALAARQRFADDGARVLGSILNHFNPSNAPSAHAHGFQHYRKYYKSYYAGGAS